MRAIILLVRVVAVHPSHTLSWPASGGIYGVLISILLARTVNASINFCRFHVGTRASMRADSAAGIAWRLPNANVEWCLQLVYDIYASALFNLVRLRPKETL
ncbi:hypothetical protein C8Q80DRAFT_1273027 [Daedaleopsis nitida]|nr:hypothetical protein C8Q80DRAFT_1273027 [Daedaleopsis nitida]